MTTLAVKWVIQDHLASLAHRRGPCSVVLCGFREEGAVKVETPFSGVREEEHCFGAFSGRGVEDGECDQRKCHLLEIKVPSTLRRVLPLVNQRELA